MYVHIVGRTIRMFNRCELLRQLLCSGPPMCPSPLVRPAQLVGMDWGFREVDCVAKNSSDTFTSFTFVNFSGDGAFVLRGSHKVSKVTSICGCPRGAGGFPPSSNFSSKWLFFIIGRSPSHSCMFTVGWLSRYVEKMFRLLCRNHQTNFLFDIAVVVKDYPR